LPEAHLINNLVLRALETRYWGLETLSIRSCL
jgi:hypothetical protein